ncbi:ABC transporter substrate-binding protein [Inquilinus limosus]|uniref:ABC transporter substrate-binding protein n=1 Tax=Inquilinus limosus TaxID=171674 RepID=UPI000426A20B|nr:extracellular solute-binding protein [Inquilinus limosus]
MKYPLHAAAGALTAVSALALSAGQGFAAGKEVVADPAAKVEYSGTLSVLTKFGLQQLSPYFINLAKEYERLHPGVTVELIQESDDSIKGKTKTLVASNSLPDIYFSWTGSWGGNFVRGRRAVDLSEVIGPDTDWGKTFAPAAIKSFQYNGKYYGIPLYLDAKFMGYNKLVFARLGLGVPASFEQLLASCDAIRQSGMTPISLGNKEAWPGVHYVGQLLAYNVPQATLEQDFDPSTAKYTDPGYVEALKQFEQLAERCTDRAAVNGTSYASALQAFSNAKSAMYYQEIIEFDQSATPDSALKVSDFGFFQLPVPAGAKGDPKAIEGAPEGYMINAASKNVPLAIDFMKFVTSPENGRILSAPPYGQPSATIGGASEGTMSPAVVEGMKQINAASYLMPWLDTANTPRVAAAWLSSLQALAGGTMTPDQVMDAVRQAASAGQ